MTTYVCRCHGWISITEAEDFDDAVRQFKSMASSASLRPSDIQELVEIDMGDGDGIFEATEEDLAWYRAMTGPIDPPKPKREEILKRLLNVGIEEVEIGDRHVELKTKDGQVISFEATPVITGDGAEMDIWVNGNSIEKGGTL